MPAGIQFYVPNLSQGSYVHSHCPHHVKSLSHRHSFRLQYIGYGGSNGIHFNWPDWSISSLLIEEREPGTRVIKTSLPEHGNGGPRNTWISSPSHSVVHNKRLDYSVIRVTVMTMIGFLGSSQTTACLWRLLVDGNEATTKWFWNHSSPYYGWLVGRGECVRTPHGTQAHLANQDGLLPCGGQGRSHLPGASSHVICSSIA